MQSVVVDYNRRWEVHQDMKKYGPASRHVRRLIKKTIAGLDIDSFIDVGCGEGSLLREIAQMFPEAEIHGADISSTAVEVAEQKISGSFHVINIEKQSLNNKFDLVICSEVLEHIRDDKEAIKNLKNMVGKYLLLVVPQGKIKKHEKRIGHYRSYDYGKMENIIAGEGLTILNKIQWGFPFYSPLYRSLFDFTPRDAMVTGQYGLVRRIAALFIYNLFKLNLNKRGDVLLILASLPEG